MKKLALIVGLLLLIIALPLIVYYVGQKQQTQSKAAPATTLSLSPAAATKQVGDEFTVNVEISTGDNQVKGSDLVISYNPQVLSTSVDKVSLGTFFTDPSHASIVRKDVDSTVGKITYSFYFMDLYARTGTGTLATIAFTALSQGTSAVQFDSTNTFVTAIGEVTGANGALIPGGLSGASYIVNAGTNPTATPTPTTAGPTATPTPTSSGPTSTPTPTTAGGTGGAGTSALMVTSPASGTSVTTSKPTFYGTAKPNSSVTIVIYPDSETGVVTASGTGAWSYTSSVDLSDGSHTYTLTERATDGTTRTTSGAFNVAVNPVPVSGTWETTLILLLAGVSFILIGAGLPFLPR